MFPTGEGSSRRRKWGRFTPDQQIEPFYFFVSLSSLYTEQNSAAVTVQISFEVGKPRFEVWVEADF